MEVIDPYSLDPVIDNNAQDDYVHINNDGYAAEVINRPNRAVESNASSWCRCGYCQNMESDIECLCCRELKHCSQKLSPEDNCLTEGEDFISLFLTPCVLRHYALTVNDTRGYGEAITWSNRYVIVYAYPGGRI